MISWANKSLKRMAKTPPLSSGLYAYSTFFRYYFDEQEDRYEKKNRINNSIPIAKWLWG